MYLKNIFITEIKSEYFFDILVYLLWSSSLFGFFNGCLLHAPIIGFFQEEIVLFLFSVLIIGSIPYILMKLHAAYVCLYVVIFIAYQLCYTLFPINSFYLRQEEVRFFGEVLPLIFLGAVFENSEKKMKFFNMLAIASIICVFFYNIVLGRIVLTDSLEQENMSAAYKFLPCVLIVFVSFLYTKKIWMALPLILGFFLLFGFGSRGPIAAILIFCILFSLHSVLKGNVKLALYLFPFASLGYIGIMNFQMEIIEFFEKIGVSTRIFTALLYADEVDSTGRDIIYNKVLNNIDFIQMHGFAGDRLLLGGTYSHNFFLEMWHSFGVLGGSLLLMPLLWVVFAALYFAKKEDSCFLIVLISFVFGQLMFSGSFLHQGWLYFLIGYCINIISSRMQIPWTMQKKDIFKLNR